MHHPAHHAPIQTATAAYSSTTTAMPVAQVAQRCHHQHRQPSACTMTIGPLNGRPGQTSVCQDEGKYSNKYPLFFDFERKYFHRIHSETLLCDEMILKKLHCFFFTEIDIA